MIESEGEEERLDLFPYLTEFDTDCCAEEGADDDGGSSARTLLIDVHSIDVAWARRFLIATQRIPPRMAVERLSCSIHTVFENDDDEARMVLDILAQALANCTFLEARVAAQEPSNNPLQVMTLCEQVAKNTVYVLRIAEVSMDAQFWVGLFPVCSSPDMPKNDYKSFAKYGVVSRIGWRKI